MRILKNYQKESNILELESIITELKNSLEGFNSRLDRQKKTVNEFEGRLFEIIETEEQKENKMKNIEESLRDYGISLSGPYMHYGSLKRREKGAESLFEKNSDPELPKSEERNRHTIS